MKEKLSCKKSVSIDVFWQNIPLFIELARQKNYSRAAELLDMNVSTLSRRIKAFEKSVGLSLFVRNTRTVELTPEGEDFYAHCVPLMQNAQVVYEKSRQAKDSVSGTVRVSIFSEMYYSFVSAELPAFLRQWPGIELVLLLTDRPADLLVEPVDLDIRLGQLSDSNLSARKLTSLELKVYAAPSLFDEYPLPTEPEDLERLPCLTLMQKGNPWVLSRGEESRRVRIHARHISNSVCAVKDFALAGQGAVLLREAAAEPLVAEGKLMRILPEWVGITLDVNMLWANTNLPARVRVVKDFLCDVFSRAR